MDERDRPLRNSTPTGFFDLCSSDAFASILFCAVVTTFYTGNYTSCGYQKRNRGGISQRNSSMRKTDAISRVYTVHPIKSECLDLRLLLHDITDPTCYDDFRTVKGNF